MATDTPEPILDLTTLRRPIRIDGKTYHLKSADELTLVESQMFTRWAKELEVLGKDGGRDKELSALLRVVAREALADVPKRVFKRLSTSMHLAVVEVFTVLLLERQVRLAGAVVSASRSTGRKSSPAFSTHSVVIPDGGSIEPQPLSSEPT